MKEQFCTYEIAKQLKEFGFNERCFGCWENNTEYGIPFIVGHDLATPEYYNLKKGCIAAPLWQQVIDWFRETHDIDIVITPDSSSGHRIPARKYFITLWKYYNGLNVQPEIIRENNKILYFVNPKNAREQAILKAIELIKEQNEKY